MHLLCLKSMRTEQTSVEMEDSLERFLDGQRFGYDFALEEVKNGEKTSHWIWYVFPQMRGLGHSPNSTFYGIASLEEAKAYASHPVLGMRLREVTEALLGHKGKSPEEILGGIDALKVRSCMTLFDKVCPDDIYAKVLDAFYGGERCRRTLNMIGDE